MTSKTIYCIFLAFITTLTIFAGCASNLKTNSAILLNANVTKTYDQFEKQNRIIYYEYVYEFGNNTYVGANSKLFNSMQLSEAVHFSNLTIVPIYVCANDVEKSQFHLYKCSRGLIDFLLIVGTVFGL